MIKKITLTLAIVNICTLARGQEPAVSATLKEWSKSPFVMKIEPLLPKEAAHARQSAYIHGRLSQLPNVTVVPRGEASDMVLSFVSTANKGIYSLTAIVLKLANGYFRDVIADRVGSKLQELGDPGWQRTQEIVRQQALEMKPAFFYEGSVGYSVENPHSYAAIDATLSDFHSRYVVKAASADREQKATLLKAAERIDQAKTPEEKMAAQAEMKRLIGLER